MLQFSVNNALCETDKLEFVIGLYRCKMSRYPYPDIQEGGMI